MSGRITLTSNPIKLSAYATSGLPVSYAIIEGDENIDILPQGEFFYLEPVQEGYAKVMAFQDGNDLYRPANPVYKIIRVINYPDYPEPILAGELLYVYDSPTNVVASIFAVPNAPLTANILETIPLEPDKVSTFKLEPNAPVNVVLFPAPYAPTIISADDKNNLPPFDVYNVQVDVAYTPLAPLSVSVKEKILNDPTKVYSLNLTSFFTKQVVTTNATVSYAGLSVSDPWNSEDASAVEWRTNMLTEALDSYGLPYNPYWQFISRQGETIPYNEFWYRNNNQSQTSGYYVPKRLGERNKYTTYWLQTELAGLQIAEQDAHKMFFAVFKSSVVYIFSDSIAGTNAEQLQIASDLYDSFYAQNANTDLDAYDDWYYNARKDYAVDIGIPDSDFVITQGCFVLDQDYTKQRYNSFRGLRIYTQDRATFANVYQGETKKAKGFNEAIAIANEEMPAKYDALAGEILHSHQGDNNVYHHPTFPLPHKENFTNSHKNYKYNPYAVGGEGIELFFGELSEDTRLPVDLDARIV